MADDRRTPAFDAMRYDELTQSYALHVQAIREDRDPRNGLAITLDEELARVESGESPLCASNTNYLS